MDHEMKRKIENQQTSKFRQIGKRDETINYIISIFNRLAQKEYKTRLDLSLFVKYNYSF